MRLCYLTLAGFLALVAFAGAQPPEQPKEDPAATKLLAEARAARLVWENFPGFTADIEVNLDGKLSHGKIEVTAEGKVHYKDLDADALKWAKPVLGSIVSHRFDGPAKDSPCAFADKEAAHPLGRAIRVLDDTMHSNYRVRDKQIIVVDRRMKNDRFTISVQETHTNPEGKYLPSSYVVNYWSLVSGELVRSEAHFQSWTRLGKLDLPVIARVVTAAKGTVTAHRIGDLGPAASSAKSLTLSKHHLLKAVAP